MSLGSAKRHQRCVSHSKRASRHNFLHGEQLVLTEEDMPSLFPRARAERRWKIIIVQIDLNHKHAVVQKMKMPLGCDRPQST